MRAQLKQTASLVRGASVLALSALLVGAGLAIPAQAAEGVPFTPTIALSVAPVTPAGSDATVNVNVDAVEGDEWTDVNGQKAPITVRVDVFEQETSAFGGAYLVSSETFIADEGPGKYPFTPQNATYVEGTGYAFVASVLAEDGSNSEYVEQDVHTQADADGTHTDYLFAPSLSYTPSAEKVEQGATVTTTFEGHNFAGRTLEVSTSLAGPFESVDAAWTEIPESVTRVTTTFDGTTEATTEPITLSRPGIYIWGHAIYTGDNIQPVFFTQWKPDGSTPGLMVEVTATGSPTEQTPAPNATPHVDPDYFADFESCEESRQAGYENIPKGHHHYSENLDRDKDGIACESDGSDSAVVIDGGFGQASTVTPANVGGFSLILGALAFSLVRLHKKASAE